MPSDRCLPYLGAPGTRRGVRGSPPARPSRLVRGTSTSAVGCQYWGRVLGVSSLSHFVYWGRGRSSAGGFCLGVYPSQLSRYCVLVAICRPALGNNEAGLLLRASQSAVRACLHPTWRTGTPAATRKPMNDRNALEREVEPAALMPSDVGASVGALVGACWWGPWWGPWWWSRAGAK
jgi:hypothetical protein